MGAGTTHGSGILSDSCGKQGIGKALWSCFEFRAGYRHSDYPLKRMSTSITNLSHNKKFYTNDSKSSKIVEK